MVNYPLLQISDLKDIFIYFLPGVLLKNRARDRDASGKFVSPKGRGDIIPLP